jgi:hypothetical protein
MRSLRRILSALLVLIRVLTIDVWKVLFGILAWWLTSWRRIFQKSPSAFDRKKRPPYSDCIPMSHPAFKVPDPLIYSQEYLMGLGLAVTWDNPDIVLRDPSVPDPVDLSSSALQPGKEYDIVARIWNSSPDAPVVDLPVSFSYLAFGIGTQRFPITDPQQPVYVTLGVKGGPDHPAVAVTRWTTPKAPGHYCIQVKLDPASDANYANNLGQENTQVVAAASPAALTFLLRNSAPRETTIRFETDTYALSDPPSCGRNGKPAFDPKLYAPALCPVPSGWLVAIHPPNLRMKSGEEQVIEVRIEPPPDFAGSKPFNINAFTEWGFLGGLTVHVQAG